MKKRNKISKTVLLLRILEIFKHYQKVKIGRILEILTSEGLISLNSNSRRLINYYLSELEDIGLIKRNGKGRGTFWEVNNTILLKNQCNLDYYQKAFLVLTFLFSEAIVFEFLRDDLKELLNFLGFKKNLLSFLAYDVQIKYLYLNRFNKYIQNLATVIKAIEEEKYLSLLFNKEIVFKRVLPTGIGIRNGKLYLIGFEEKGQYRTYSFEKISQITIRNEKYLGKRYPLPGNFLTFSEKSFVFGLKIEKPLEVWYGEYIFHPLAFKYLREDNSITVYMVGFTSRYFASRFMIHTSNTLIPPNEEMLNSARKQKLDLKYPDLPLKDLNENLKRFGEFLDYLESEMEDRLKRVKEIKNRFKELDF